MSTQSHKDVELGGIQDRIDRIRAVGIDEGLYRLRMEAEISAIVVGVEALWDVRRMVEMYDRYGVIFQRC